ASWAVAMNSSSCLGLRFPSAMPAGRFHAQTGFKIPSPRKEFFNGLLMGFKLVLLTRQRTGVFSVRVFRPWYIYGCEPFTTGQFPRQQRALLFIFLLLFLYCY
ncbi:MAG TPA: hypothetical protein VFW05_14375, partial [Verrucomicrobiae bacterium]|nr:hypothetical protein [Verrucomicrobiae bacterium]